MFLQSGYQQSYIWVKFEDDSIDHEFEEFIKSRLEFDTFIKERQISNRYVNFQLLITPSLNDK